MNNKETNSKDATKIKKVINGINNINNIKLSINFGDALNIFGLFVGVFVLKSLLKQYNLNKNLLKENKKKND